MLISCLTLSLYLKLLVKHLQIFLGRLQQSLDFGKIFRDICVAIGQLLETFLKSMFLEFF